MQNVRLLSSGCLVSVLLLWGPLEALNCLREDAPLLHSSLPQNLYDVWRGMATR